MNNTENDWKSNKLNMGGSYSTVWSLKSKKQNSWLLMQHFLWYFFRKDHRKALFFIQGSNVLKWDEFRLAGNLCIFCISWGQFKYIKSYEDASISLCVSAVRGFSGLCWFLVQWLILQWCCLWCCLCMLGLDLLYFMRSDLLSCSASACSFFHGLWIYANNHPFKTIWPHAHSDYYDSFFPTLSAWNTQVQYHINIPCDIYSCFKLCDNLARRIYSKKKKTNQNHNGKIIIYVCKSMKKSLKTVIPRGITAIQCILISRPMPRP